MWWFERKGSAAVVSMAAALAGWGLLGVSAQGDGGRAASKLALTAENAGQLHALVRPHENEWRHLRVKWLTDVVAARKKAAAEDRPIVICYTGGAGYNEPLGVC
jgi:hypothetical protein